MCCFFFFCKQKTAYEMRISDWSSDVCSSDLLVAGTLLILPVALFVDAPWRLALPSAPTLFAIGGLALLSTTVAYFLYFSLIARAGATNALLVTLLIQIGRAHV